LGPLLGGLLIFSEDATAGSADLSSVQLPYIIIGVVVLLVTTLFKFTSLPEITEETHEVSFANKGLLGKSHFSWGVIAQFFYVGAQVAIGSFFINYATEVLPDLSNQNAAFYLSGSMFLFTIGRFFGTFLMRFARPQMLLTLFAACNILLMGVVMAGQGEISVYALMASNFFMSIMFPTIFALSLKNLGEQTKQGASFLIMSVVGGALLPPVMGFIADKLNTELSFSVPLICFIIVLSFAIKGYRIK
jgi:FHS family L-fucose permease-like MFS transporter